MTKVDMVEQIQYMKNKMDLMIQRTGLTRNIFLIHESSGQFPMAFIRPGYKWIKAIFDIEFQAAQNIRKQVSEEQWDSYKKMAGMGTEELTEVIEMNKALVRLRMAVSCKTRPDFFKRSKQRVEFKRAKKK